MGIVRFRRIHHRPRRSTRTSTTPLAYLRDTTPEVSTDCLYWTNRLIAPSSDAHFYETSNAVEGFSEDVRSFGHRLVERTDDALATAGATDAPSVTARLAAANDEMADYLRKRNTKLLGDVLYVQQPMHNSFAMSDH